MKKCLIAVIALICSFLSVNMVFAVTNTWTQKTDFGGGIRYRAVGFSIGSKGYVGTGNGISSYYKDFWEYNPVLNTWTQKADFGGTGRTGAVGFSIGSKGYIGTGVIGQDINGVNLYDTDFWEYDPRPVSAVQRDMRPSAFPLGVRGT